MFRPEFNIYDLAFLIIMAVIVVTNFISYKWGRSDGYYDGTRASRRVARQVRRHNVIN